MCGFWRQTNMKRMILVVAVVVAMGLPGRVRAAIECDARNYDTLCHVYLPVIIGGGGERED